MNAKKESFKQISKTVLKKGAFLLIIIGITSLPKTNFALTSNQIVSAKEINIQDEAFAKKFREGRDLMDSEEWAKAAEKFKEAISGYPNNKSVDAALYWLAFCYKKQKKFKEMEIMLDRLLKEFPASSWSDDARVMKNEIPGPPIPVTPVTPVTPPISVASPDKSLSVDREDEIKIAAFKSLLSADPKRAIQTLDDVLTRDSNAGEILKQSLLRVLRRPFLLENQARASLSASGAGNPLLAQLRETLIKGFQADSSDKIRQEIIYVLAGLDNEQSVNYLAELYASENNPVIKKAIINSFGNVYNFISRNFLGFGYKENSSRKVEFDKLAEIIRLEKDVELRRLAFSRLQSVGLWTKTKSKVADTFIQLYDAETDEQLKISIIHALGDGKENQALQKLSEITKNDKSDKLKLEAAFALRMGDNLADIVKSEGITSPLHQANVGKITFMSKLIPIADYKETDFLKTIELRETSDLYIRVFMNNSLTNYLHRLAPKLTAEELIKNGNYQFSFYVDDVLIYTENLNVFAGSPESKNTKTILSVPLMPANNLDIWSKSVWQRFRRNGGEDVLTAGTHLLKIEIRPYLKTTVLKVGDLIAEGDLRLTVVKP